MMNRQHHLTISPQSRGGSYTVDTALDVGLFIDVVGYETRSPGVHRLVYTDGSRGRAVITCHGFELAVLGYDDFTRRVHVTIEP